MRLTLPRRVTARRAVLGLGAAIVLASTFWAVDDLPHPGPHALLTLGSFLGAVLLGEAARVRVMGRRETAPMSMAAALALVMAPVGVMSGAEPLRASLVVVVVAAAMGLGALLHRALGRRMRVAESLTRLVGISLAATLYRRVPFGGRTLMEWQLEWEDRRWLVGIVMVLVSSIAVAVEVLLQAALHSQREHAPLRRVVKDEFRDALGLTAALVTTGALIALALPALGLMALPLFLFPLVLSQFAVRRYGAVRETYGQTIGALSRLTELAGYTRGGHAARVSRLAVAIGRELGMAQRELTELGYAAQLHDLGQVALRAPIPGGATVMAAPGDQQRIAHDGAEIVRRTGVLDSVAVILEAQSVPYRQVQELGEDLPLASRIIKVANAYDDFASARVALPWAVSSHRGGEASGPGAADDDEGPLGQPADERAMERIHLGLGYEYDPQVVDALARALERRAAATSPK
jgi:hypothetical protein